MMANYLRSLFGSNSGRSRSNSTPGPKQGQPQSSKLSKSHGRNHSSAGAPTAIYATMPVGASPKRQTAPAKPRRANSYSDTPAMKPSPLRVDQSRRSLDHERSQTPTRPIYRSSRSSSRNPHDGRYPAYVGSGYATSSSSRTNSTSSLYPGSVAGSHHYAPSPLAPSSHGSASARSSSERGRPQLKQNHTWPNSVDSTGSAASAFPSRSRQREQQLNMHPLLAYARRHPAPLSFDVAFTPSARSVLDRTMHAPVPAVTLAQPATEPPIPANSRLVLRSEKFPWLVVVGPVGSAPMFTIGGSGKSRTPKSSAALTNLDVLYAVHTTLMTRITPEEWAGLGAGSKAQRKVAAAYEKRCTRMGGGWEGGVRRVDWLHSKTHLVGIEMDKNSPAGGKVGKLIFGRG